MAYICKIQKIIDDNIGTKDVIYKSITEVSEHSFNRPMANVYIVVMSKLADSVDDENRDGIINKMNALFQIDRAMVELIVNRNTGEIKDSVIASTGHEYFTGEIIEDIDKKITYALSINYFYGSHLLSKVDGPYEYYTRDKGVLQIETYYKNKKTCGMYKHYDYYYGYLSYQCNMIDGKTEGIMYDYYGNGNVYKETNYQNGKREGIMQERNGKHLIKRMNYADDMLNGLYEEWFRDGQPKIKCTYNNNRKDGLYEEWHENGYIKIMCWYENGYIDGLYEEWFETGELIKSYVYRKNKLMSKNVIQMSKTLKNKLDKIDNDKRTSERNWRLMTLCNLYP